MYICFALSYTLTHTHVPTHTQKAKTCEDEQRQEFKSIDLFKRANTFHIGNLIIAIHRHTHTHTFNIYVYLYV